MKRNFTFVAATMALAFAAGAAPVNPDAALASVRDRVAQQWPSGTFTLKHTFEYNSRPALYVFTHEQGGFIVVAADDAATRPLVGVCHEGGFEVNDLPDPLRDLLEANAKAVVLAAESTADSTGPLKITAPNGQQRTTISPLVSSRWNQDSPYNQACPTVKNASGASVKPQAGCVAIAMSQLMRAHKWPLSGTGSSSYSWTDTYGNSYSTSATFGTFNWNNMFDTDGTTTTDAQKAEVAKLVFHCGAAVKMVYGATASGAQDINVPTALIGNFGYDAGMRYLAPCWFSDENLRTVVYNEIASSRPVYFIGESSAARHSFLIDGYASSYESFHFNFGYVGSYGEGYYDLPNAGGYTSNQVMLTEIKKNAGGSYQPCLALTGSLSASRTSISIGSYSLTFSGEYMSYSLGSASYEFGLYVDGAGGNKVVSATSTGSLGYKTTGNLSISVTTSAENFPVGTYNIYPVFRKSGTTAWTPFYCDVRSGKKNAYTLTVNSSYMTLSQSAVAPSITIVNGPEEGSNPEPTTQTDIQVNYKGFSVSDATNMYPGASVTTKWDIVTNGAIDCKMYARIHDDYGNVICSSATKNMQYNSAISLTDQEWTFTIPASTALGRYNLALIKVDDDGTTSILNAPIIYINEKQTQTETETVNTTVEFLGVEYEYPYYPGLLDSKAKYTYKITADGKLSRNYCGKIIRSTQEIVCYAEEGGADGQKVEFTSDSGGETTISFTVTISRTGSDATGSFVMYYNTESYKEMKEDIQPITYIEDEKSKVTSLASYYVYAKLLHVRPHVQSLNSPARSESEYDTYEDDTEIINSSESESSDVTELEGGKQYDFTWETAYNPSSANVEKSLTLYSKFASSVNTSNMGTASASSSGETVTYNNNSTTGTDFTTQTFTVTAPTTTGVYNVGLVNKSSDDYNYFSYPSTQLTVVTPTSINVIGADGDKLNESGANPVYYNLQGMRVDNPSNGVFIMVRGNRSKKVVMP